MPDWLMWFLIIYMAIGFIIGFSLCLYFADISSKENFGGYIISIIMLTFLWPIPLTGYIYYAYIKKSF